MKWAIQAKEKEKNKPQTFSADGWTGESKIFTNVVKKWARTLLSQAKDSKNKWAEWLGRGRGRGIRRPRSFVPVGDTNRDKRGAFYPGCWLQPGQKVARAFVPVGATNQDKRPLFVPVGVSNRDKTPWPPYPLPSPPARAIQLTCFLLFLARERWVLAHFFTTFVKIFDSPSIHRR